MDNQGSDNGVGVGSDAGSESPDAGASTGSKQVLITSEADGTFTVQPMADGQPVGDATLAKTIDEAMQGATDALGASPAAENPDASGDAGLEANPGEAGDQSAEPAPDDAAMQEAKTQYAQKRGTRPKVMPNWKDYGVDTMAAK